MDEILPMAANLQMVFFKKQGETPTDSTVLVLFLHNEKPVRPHLIPTPSPSRGEGSLISIGAMFKVRIVHINRL
jgi:hypothetical protein